MFFEFVKIFNLGLYDFCTVRCGMVLEVHTAKIERSVACVVMI